MKKDFRSFADIEGWRTYFLTVLGFLLGAGMAECLGFAFGTVISCVSGIVGVLLVGIMNDLISMKNVSVKEIVIINIQRAATFSVMLIILLILE